jgi:uncharacterized protein (DUF1800 family)
MRRQALFNLGITGVALAGLQAAIGCARDSRSGKQPPLATERDKIAHLLRRAGFGYGYEDLEQYVGLGVTGAIDRLLDYEQISDDDLEQRLKRLHLDLTRPADMQRWWLVRMIYTKRPLQEKMTLFWHGLLTSQTGKVPLPRPRPQNPNPPNLMLNQIQFFREHALDDHATIMKGISRDPAMVIYLDSRDNRKGKPNENYARELMELFTLGITGPDGSPNYAEQDVREAARAFTGWTLTREQQFAFNAGQHDTGQKTIFGQTGNFNGDEVIDLIMAHPSSAYHICGKLFSFFAYDDPEPAVLAPMIDAFHKSNGSIKATLRAILTSPAFFSPKAYRAKAKSPVELVAGAARALQIETDAMGFQLSTQRMGQTLFNPPNVAGWPGGLYWFATSTWLARLNHLSQLLSARQDPHTRPPQLAGIVQRFGLYTPEKMVDFLLQHLVDGQVEPPQRQVLLDYAKQGVSWPAPPTPGSKASGTSGFDETHPVVDQKMRGLFYLIMSSPEYQLA